MPNDSTIRLALLAVFGATIGSLAGAACAQDRLTQQEVNTQIVQEMKRFAEPFNRTLPRQIGDGVLLEKITIGPGVLMNYHSLLTNYASTDIDSVKMNNTIRPLLKQNICGNAELKPLLQYGTKFVYTIRGNDGVALSSLRFDRTDCGYPMLRP